MWFNEKRVFVTGTGTEVGKTMVSGKLVEMYQNKGFRTGYYKPVATGSVLKNGIFVCQDAHYIKNRYQLEQTVESMCPLTFTLPAAPMVSAEYENKDIRIGAITDHYKKLCQTYETLVVEGVGGVMVPICENYFVLDLIKELQLSCVVVTRPDLGTLNHTLLTLKALKGFGITVLGLFISHTNPRELDPGESLALPLLSKLGNVPLLHQFNFDMEAAQYE